jgi:phospholipid transport system substrate-binding protein
MFRHLLLIWLLAGLVLTGPWQTPAATAGPDPTEQLRPLVDRIVEILTDPELQGEENCARRRQLVMDVAEHRFDFVEMSKRVLGRQWRKLSPEQQDQFVNLFTTLLEHAYLGKIEDYSNQKANFTNQRIKGDRAQVDMDVIDQDVVIPVSYIMILHGETWMVYDIVVEGVSLVRNYMEQFREIIRRDGYPGLLEQLEEKIAELEKSAGKPCPTDLATERTAS